jgi:hypothetical protein
MGKTPAKATIRSPMDANIRMPSGEGQPMRCREWFRNILECEREAYDIYKKASTDSS